MRPQRIENVTREYPSTQTFTLQSAFKYDNTPEEVQTAIRTLRERPVTPPPAVDEDRCLELIARFSKAYQEQVAQLAPIINRVARYIPRARMRKLHIGLFGYAREMGAVSCPAPFPSPVRSIRLACRQRYWA